jgi:hypothetical protein
MRLDSIAFQIPDKHFFVHILLNQNHNQLPHGYNISHLIAPFKLVADCGVFCAYQIIAQILHLDCFDIKSTTCCELFVGNDLIHPG